MAKNKSWHLSKALVPKFERQSGTTIGYAINSLAANYLWGLSTKNETLYDSFIEDREECPVWKETGLFLKYIPKSNSPKKLLEGQIMCLSLSLAYQWT